MKIIVLHGDDSLRSYERLQEFIEIAQSRGWDIRRISDSSVNIPEVLVGDTLFEKEKLVVVEDAKLISKSVAKWLNKATKNLDLTLVILATSTLAKTFINSLPKPVKTEEFKLPKFIWKLLDSFYPGNAKNTLFLLHEVVKKEPIEFVFALLARQVKDLYWVKIDSRSMKLPSWRIGKLKNQASKFKESQLKELISDLAAADIKSKTSQANLIDELDFIIATQLQ